MHLDVKDLIRKILNHNIKKRLDTIDMLGHPWNAYYPTSVPAPIYAEAKHTIERCFNPSLATHIRSMINGPPFLMQPPKIGLRRPAPGMPDVKGTKFADAIQHPHRQL